MYAQEIYLVIILVSQKFSLHQKNSVSPITIMFAFIKRQFRMYTLYIPTDVLKNLYLRGSSNERARAWFVHLAWIHKDNLSNGENNFGSLRPEFAHYGNKYKCTRTETVLIPMSEVCTTVVKDCSLGHGLFSHNDSYWYTITIQGNRETDILLIMFCLILKSYGEKYIYIFLTLVNKTF